MTKSEILQVAKPILFNTEMVRAISDGRKTMTRQVIKPQPQGHFEVSENPIYIYDTDLNQGKIMPPYQTGDILYVKETWAYGYCSNCDGDMDTGICSKRANGKEPIGCYFYRADSNIKWDDGKTHWHPSVHMPKEAAWIFLKVTEVRVERLQEITLDQIYKEGVQTEYPYQLNGEENIYAFRNLWTSTIKKKDLEKYGFGANPWVWVIEFEKVEVDG